jgi:hypothetical protein
MDGRPVACNGDLGIVGPFGSVACDRLRSDKTIHMSNLLYIIAVIMIIGWLLGVFVYSATGLIHLLLVIALVAVLLRVIQGKSIGS